MFPENIVEAGITLNLLGIIVVAFALGIILSKYMSQQDAKPILDIINALNSAVTQVCPHLFKNQTFYSSLKNR